MKQKVPHSKIEDADLRGGSRFYNTGGDFPKGKMKLLEAWMEIHREELEAHWTLISNGEQVSRVDPLK